MSEIELGVNYYDVCCRLDNLLEELDKARNYVESLNGFREWVGGGPSLTTMDEYIAANASKPDSNPELRYKFYYIVKIHKFHK